MIRKTLLFSFAILLAVAVQIAPAATYTVDDVHSQVQFKVAHLMISTVRGEFTDYSATIKADPESKTVQSVVATIQTASIDTRNKKRDDHLRSADFFYVDKYPEMTFKSTGISGKGDNISVVGDLTIRGNTRPVELKGSFAGEVTDPWGNTKSGFEASGTIDRKDYGLTWNKVLETGGFVVGDEVEIVLEIEAARAD